MIVSEFRILQHYKESFPKSVGIRIEVGRVSEYRI